MANEQAGAATAPKILVPFHSWWMVAVLFTLYVFSWLDRLIISMLVIPIKADLGVSDFQIGLLTGTAFAIAYSVFGLPLGWAVDRFTRRWIILGGVVLWATATVASGMADSFAHLLIARICVGIGEAALLPAAYSLLADEFPRERLTLATSTFQMGGKAGSAAAFALGGIAIAYAATLHGTNLPLLGYAEPWQIVFAMVGLPGFVLALLVFTFREPARRNPATAAQMAAQSDWAVLGEFLRTHRALMVLMLLSFSSLAICGYTLTNWVPTYLTRAFGWTPLQYGLPVSILNLIGGASLVVTGAVVDHFFSKRLMKDAHLRVYSWLLLAIAPAAVMLFITGSPYVFLACYCVVQFATVPFMVYASSVVSLLAPNRVRGKLIAGFLFCFTMLGLGAGPALVGALTTFVFASDARIGTSMMIVVVGCYGLAFVTMRMALLYLKPAIERAEGRG